MPNYRITESQCPASGCTKKAKKGQTFCSGKVCRVTSSRKYRRGTHTNIAEAKWDMEDRAMRYSKFKPDKAEEKPEAKSWTKADIDDFYESRF